MKRAALLGGAALMLAQPAGALVDPAAFSHLGFRQHPGAQLPLDAQFRDELGLPVTLVTSKRTTLRGTAIMALDVLAPGTPRAKPATGPVRRPVAAHHAHYARRAQAYQALYDAVIGSP